MSEKDSISIHLVREALLQSCAPGAATVEALSKVGIAPALLEQPDARVPATAYARLWRLLARRHDDEFFGMDPRRLKSGSLAFLCHASMAQPTLATGLETALGFLSLMLEQMPAQLVRQQSLTEIVLAEPAPKRAFTYFTYWMIVHGVACWLAARATGISNREALGIGTLMNARGLMELIIINIGLQRGIISEGLFATLVIMAVITTLMASPIFEFLVGSRAQAVEAEPEPEGEGNFYPIQEPGGTP